MSKEKEFATFLALQNLLGHFDYARETSRGLRRKIDAFEKKVSEALSEASDKQQKITAFYALDELKAGQNVPKEALDKLNALYLEKSSLSSDETRFLTEKEYNNCFPYEDNVISRGGRKLIEFWVVIKEKEDNNG